MDLIDIVLRIIEMFTLTDPEEQRKLQNECNAWRKDAVIDHENKVKAMYAKVRQGIALRLINPFLYFIVVKKMKNLMSEDDGKFID